MPLIVLISQLKRGSSLGWYPDYVSPTWMLRRVIEVNFASQNVFLSFSFLQMHTTSEYEMSRKRNFIEHRAKIVYRIT